MSGVYIDPPETFRDAIQHLNYKLLDTVGRRYEHVGHVNVDISVAVDWCGIHIVLSNMYIDPLETYRTAILRLHLQITG